MAEESPNRRARSARERQANVAGGRPHRTVVKLSAAEQTELAARAAAGGVSVPRYLVDTAMGRDGGEPGRAAAVGAILDLDEQIRRIGNNINQLTRYAHQNREVSEEIVSAFRAFVRTSLILDETARWVMGKAPAVALDAEALEAVDLPSGDADPDSWANQIDG